jgi:thioesterase domain-containing protein/acyl carrier protein
VARGYLNRPELTAEKFIANPFGAGRLYRTGDLARWLPDGNLEYLGRIDQQVKLRGFRIELGEIERVLSSHAAVQEVAVVAREDMPGEQRLVAYVVERTGVQGSRSRGQETEGAQLIAELRSYLQARLPDYMLPSAFVLLGTLPLTPNGKLDRKALPEPTITTMAVDDAPRTATEALLAAIWQQLLNLPQVSTQANFFALGGHSLLAMRLLSSINQTYERTLPLTALFAHPTIAALAALLDDRAEPREQSSLVAIQPKGSRPPLICCPGAGGSVRYFHHLAQALGNDQPLYGLVPLGIDGRAQPHSSVEAAAAYQLHALRTAQPNGPYYLVGHSFGGLVAFEMAQQLYRAGAELGALIILDSSAPGADPHAISEVEAILLYERLYLEELGVAPSLTAEQLEPLTSDERLLALKRVFTTAGLLPGDAHLDQVRGIIRVAMANMLTVYLPTDVQRLPLRLILAADTRSEERHALTTAWSTYSEVEVQQTTGNHTSMLYPPHVQHVAQIITELVLQREVERRRRAT